MRKTYHVLFSILIIIALIFSNFASIKGNLYMILRNVPKSIVLYKTKNYKKYNTEHFIIRYKTNDKEIVKLVAKASETYYDKVCKQFGYYPEDKTMVILYDNSKELLKNANLGESKPPMGVYYASTIQVLSPKLWTPSQEDIEYLFMNEGPMVHEFTHLIVDDITRGNYPLWFTEGIALYSEYIHTNFEWGKEVKLQKIYTIDELNSEFNKLDQYLAYTQSFRVVKYIVETYGYESLMEILDKLKEGYNFEKAFETVTKNNISSLNI